MKKAIKRIGIVLLILIALFSLFLSWFLYETEYKRTEVLISCAEDGQHKLLIEQIGDPDFPFGYAHCQFFLIDGREKITSCKFDIADDGGSAQESNFQIVWRDDSVETRVSASEQRDVYYRFFFDGRMETRHSN